MIAAPSDHLPVQIVGSHRAEHGLAPGVGVRCAEIVLHPKFWLGLAVDLAVPLLWDLDCLRQYLCCVLAGHSEPPEPQNLASSGVCVRTELKISDFKCMRSKMLGLNLQFR